MQFKEFLIVGCSLALLGMIGYLLFAQKLKGREASFVVVAAGIFLLLALNVDTVSSIAISWGKSMDLRVETKQMRDEVYAKAEHVKELGEQVARFTAHTVATSGRWVGEDHQQRMLEERENIRTMMRSLGSAPDKIAEVLGPIDKMVASDLKGQVIAAVGKIKRLEQKPDEQLVSELRAKFQGYDSPASHDNLVVFLKERKVYDESVENALNRVDLFLREKHL